MYFFTRFHSYINTGEYAVVKCAVSTFEYRQPSTNKIFLLKPKMYISNATYFDGFLGGSD